MKRASYPLQWPDGWPRTDWSRREVSRFRVHGFARARDQLLREIDLLGGVQAVITSFLPVRLDGLPYGNASEPCDPGVAAYWVQRGRERVMACDRWTRARDNMHAVALSIAALRGLDRWGTTSIIERAFAGFAALPPAPDPEHWSSVLGIERDRATVLNVCGRFKELARTAHPDAGGSTEGMQRLNAALEAAKRELGA